MSISRFNAVEKASNRKAVEAVTPEHKVSEYYGENVFNRKAMQKYLSKETYKALTHAIDNGTPIDREIANHVAAGMRMWALEKGVTHYTHWFQPLTDGTAEKHDAFVEHDGNGGMIEEFSGKLLVQQEPDASSFPNGGLRNTFEARGYSAWDPSSPAFIVDDTLCIPTVFIAYTGEALDYKTPLIRSIEVLGEAAKDVYQYFDEDVNKIITYLGWEQEYFLVDEDLYSARPDLSLTERTLLGHESAKNQQLDDHYFGAIPSRVQEFMKDLETECYKLGIPVKTRHNEVAPNQFELAPIYEECNLANDHNQLLMSVMKRVSRRHNFRVLLHEKPFAGINGSGKHNNWSLGTDTGTLLFAPGKTPRENLRFITFFAIVMAAVHRHNGLLKASIASATNAHRLGANEAPPAIISMFLGEQLEDVVMQLIDKGDATSSIQKGKLKTGASTLPDLNKDATDRNRTSPFAFTGNKFEFRMVGSSDSIAPANVVLNTIVAESFKEIADELEGSEDMQMAVHDMIKKLFTDHHRVVFNGNGYSDEWVEEAERRGLPNIKSMVEAVGSLVKPETVKMFEGFGVFTEAELKSRAEIKYEAYSKAINIEAKTMIDMAGKEIIPAIISYTTELANSVLSVKEAGADASVQADILTEVSGYLKEMKAASAKLAETVATAATFEGKAQAEYFRDTVKVAMDEAEMIVDKEFWPFPSYSELLFEV